jgi:Na+-driven multidrug efflux pump
LGTEAVKQNPLGTEPIGKLQRQFAIPAIASGLVSALYNIVDQIFIGQSVGLLGNGATNVAFPVTTICMAIALLLGIGTANNFSLNLGRGDRARAMTFVGNGVSMLAICGIVLSGAVLLFLEPLMRAFGATTEILPHALTYTGITAFGIPFFIFSTGGSHIVRADGSPRYSMAIMLSGAVLNLILDPILIFGFDLGMAGAAIATIIGQIVSGILTLLYFTRFKTAPIVRSLLRPRMGLIGRTAALGMGGALNQAAMTVVQIVMNNTLTHYGALSVYGSDIPMGCVGVISKVLVILVAIVIGIGQGCQPIIGFNYGAKNYARVRETYQKAILAAVCISTAAFLCFQLFPHQIVAIFGTGSDLYFQFAERYLRIYMMLTAINCVQPITGMFFSAIGKARIGAFISLTRQILLLIPMILLFPLIWGIDGVMYAGPISDAAAVAIVVTFVSREMRKLRALQTAEEQRRQKESPVSPV